MANDRGTLAGRRISEGVDVGLYAPHALAGSLALVVNEREIERRPVSLAPGQVYRAVWPLPAEAVGNLRLVFEDADGAQLLTGQVE